MKVLKFVALVCILSIGLVGCAKTDDAISDEQTTPSLKEMIEDFANYTVITDANVKSFVPTCDAYSEEFAQKVKDGDVKRLLLYAEGDYALQVYATPNYDGWTEADFEKVNSCGELGSVLAVKIVGDSLLWSYPGCSAGAVPNNDDPGYVYFAGCTVVEEQLREYLGGQGGSQS